MQDEWFLKWFNSPYYDLLYRHRSEEEARAFLDRLLFHLSPSKASLMLDLACGNGRFSHYLALKGFDVTGLDISESKITDAISKAKELGLSSEVEFFKHDMRNSFRHNYFDYVFNFFTSFGYFENDADHITTIENIYAGLKPKGIFILDFLNVKKTINHLIAEEEHIFEGIPVVIKRKFVDGYIQKRIELKHRNKNLEFTERVRAFDYTDFQKMMEEAGLRILTVFGDYQLNPFDEESSDRLIIKSEKV
ncbi:MAG: class I SAM-dependent methyltransferase [Saprospirales bacterium]|nr:MAG: class I SAM-dependent methyltransferase [Saprospirales bacterium]